ncbi:hypothetical protein HYU13_02070 [Candidatus Woesearchaeota archaeon]|nr:hypothetical protein [Candidatus Woesearchaeota archaeon]
MSQPKILSEKPMDLASMRQELEKIQKRDKELGFRSNKTFEYLNQFGAKSPKQDLIKKLQDLNIPRLKDIHFIKIADFLPKTVEDLKLVLQGYPITVNNDNLKKIVDFISSEEKSK